jgi:hypothetical protein
MATMTPAFREDGRLMDMDGVTVESSTQAAHERSPRWTAAHAEAARFLGECVAAGAVLGMVAAAGRSRRGQ